MGVSSPFPGGVITVPSGWEELPPWDGAVTDEELSCFLEKPSTHRDSAPVRTAANKPMAAVSAKRTPKSSLSIFFVSL